MLKKFLATTIAMAVTGVASAQSLDLVGLDGANGWTATLSGGGAVAGFDAFQNLADANDGWLGGGIFGATTANGATFRLVEPDARAADPNLVDFVSPTATGDTADARLTTFLSLPRAAQNASKRFDRTDEPGTTAPFTYGPNAIDNTNAFYPPPGNGDAGFWARVIVNVPAGIDPSLIYVANSVGSPSDIVLASGEFTWGTIATGTDPIPGPSVDTPWVIAAVPEPGSIALLALGALAAVRRR